MAIAGRFCDTSVERRHLRKRQAAWHGAHQRHPVRAEVEQDRADQAADHEDERARDPRSGEAEPEDDGKGNERRPAASPG